MCPAAFADDSVDAQALARHPRLLVLDDPVEQAIDGVPVLTPQRERRNGDYESEQNTQNIGHRFVLFQEAS